MNLQKKGESLMEEGFNRLFMMFFSGMIIWVILGVLVFYAQLRFAQYIAKEKAARIKNQHKARKGGKKRSKSVKRSSKASEINTMPDKDYESAKQIFNCAMKNGQLNREKILGLKDLLNQMLSGSNKYKSYYFKNDCHEIYVKLKDGRLGMLDYQKIIDYITKEIEDSETTNNGNAETV